MVEIVMVLIFDDRFEIILATATVVVIALHQPDVTRMPERYYIKGQPREPWPRIVTHKALNVAVRERAVHPKHAVGGHHTHIADNAVDDRPVGKRYRNGSASGVIRIPLKTVGAVEMIELSGSPYNCMERK